MSVRTASSDATRGGAYIGLGDSHYSSSWLVETCIRAHARSGQQSQVVARHAGL